MEPQQLTHVFVPVDRETLELEAESVFMDAFAGGLMGCVLGTAGLEHLADLIDGGKMLHELSDAVRPQVTPQAINRAIQRYRAHPTPFPPGMTPGVWVEVCVPRRRLNNALARLYPALALENPQPQPVATAPVAAKRDVPWRKVYYPQLRPRWA